MNIIEIQNKELYKKAIEKFGIKSQINIFCEECSELMQAIFKSRRYGKIQENFYEEVADVKIMLEQMFTELKIDINIEIYILSGFSINNIFDKTIESCLALIKELYRCDEIQTYQFTDFIRNYDWVRLWNVIDYYYKNNNEVKVYYNQKIERLKGILEGK